MRSSGTKLPVYQSGDSVGLEVSLGLVKLPAGIAHDPTGVGYVVHIHRPVQAKSACDVLTKCMITGHHTGPGMSSGSMPGT